MLALALSAGCENDLPTIVGADRLPGGAAPVTVQVTLEPEQFLRADTVFTDYTDPRDAPFLLVANAFDGALEAHSLARFTGFPDSVATYGAGRVVTTVVEAASSSPGPARLQLWALDQAWDSASVTWTAAEQRDGTTVPWTTPGGSRGALLAEAVWVPGDTIAPDSVVFAVDSLAVARMAAEGFPGLLVTSETPGSRLRLTRLSLTAGIRTVARPDTSVARTMGLGPQDFIFTPDLPAPGSLYRVGGLTGDRTVLRLDLSQRVPGCADPATDPACPSVALRDVTLNRALLVLEPSASPAGFRPLTRTDVRVRRVVETELGRRAPLAESFAADSVSAALFAAPGGEPISLDLTAAVTQVVSRDTSETTIAILAEPEGGRFGPLWFAARPRLRLVYTLPLRPTLP